MKSKKLLFVLGAGASAAYGFPNGRQLVHQILHTNLVNTFASFAAVLAITNDQLLKFQEDLRIADLPSVDAFLENNPRYLKIGKLVVAFFLSQFESYDRLYGPNREDNWYQYLVDKMLRNYPFSEIENNNISFITYNYDRSLEFYLFNALRRSNENITDKQCLDKLAKFRVLHIHGSLGKPKYLASSDGRSYEAGASPSQLLQSEQDIHIISEDVEKYVEFSLAYDMISDADRLLFLGFGYHPVNLQRLSLDKHLKPTADLWGTAFGLTGSEQYYLVTRQFQPRTINLESTTCSGLLSNHLDLILD